MRKSTKPTFSHRINHQITAKNLRVIGPDNQQIGVMSISDALNKAQEMGADLIEIAPKASPPVARIVELGKFRYELEKKLRKEKKGVKGGEIKEIRFTPFIGDADYETRINKIKEFLGEGNKVRIVVKFKGRQMGSKPFGYNLTKKITEHFGDQINIDMPPKFIGRHLTTVISPLNKARAKPTPSKKKTD